MDPAVFLYLFQQYNIEERRRHPVLTDPAVFLYVVCRMIQAGGNYALRQIFKSIKTDQEKNCCE